MGDRAVKNILRKLASEQFIPVTWRDENGEERNGWTRNLLTGEIEPDPEGDPLYTTAPQAGHE